MRPLSQPQKRKTGITGYLQINSNATQVLYHNMECMGYDLLVHGIKRIDSILQPRRTCSKLAEEVKSESLTMWINMIDKGTLSLNTWENTIGTWGAAVL